MQDAYRYQFLAGTQPEDVEVALVLALFSAESLHGEVQVRLDAIYTFDRTRLVLVIDASTDVGQDFNRLFVGFLKREFGDAMFSIEHHLRTMRIFPINSDKN